ncbi:MAG TPA: HAD family hydrolase [Dehalococcoidia bacterium]|nr:HAD family hydrolase [Dehalococcoidia bacterium]
MARSRLRLHYQPAYRPGAISRRGYAGGNPNEVHIASIAAIIFDLGGTLVDWPDWDTAWEERWGSAFDFYRERALGSAPERGKFVEAMHAAELAHWRRVEEDCWSGPPASVIQDGFRRMGQESGEHGVLVALDGYARAVSGWAQVYPDARSTLLALRERGLSLGLVSNTWWAASWHNADLAEHGLEDLIDVAVYTSDLPHSKPHASVFKHVTARLAVPPEQCVMVGDRPVDDISGALRAGMTAVLKTNGHPRPIPDGVHPSATIETLSELPAVLERLASH